ncbi:beta-galactosidase [Pseudoflavitalea sp. X16]|uniref:glycoside hydrolase family 2 protein n=1 Tax=Paraflavitalea devenefica TaxID=2716334 RepID=UPI001422BA47|nr:glycoside hydrolase family 2 TIM barrel-domain containing protein [Paraflavitalea devenefica]NII27368.1 beta-galactosidase [Paraflavitalea devenefica]
MKLIYSIILLGWPLLAGAQGRTSLSLNGAWIFTLDPVKVGEANHWYATDFVTTGFDKVQVPHSFSVDKRYSFYTGTAWYFKNFPSAAVQPGQRAFLQFEAVFYKTTVWLNDKKVGAHEGGYTPFELDVTEHLQAKNTLALSVNNEWDTTTIPGAKTSDAYSRTDHSQLYPWINYGGITRPVRLIIRPDVFLQKAQVIALPDQPKGEARIRIKAFISNLGTQPVQTSLTANIYYGGQKINTKLKPVVASVAANGSTPVVLEGVLPAAAVKRWYPDEPNLYTAEIITGRDTLNTPFGIRTIAVKGTQLLLNGEPIRMGGCNRPLDYPGYGSLDPDVVLEKDLALIRNGSMEFSRLSHYPMSESLLNWADKNGLLIIAEAGNWQMTPRQMADPLMRAKFQAQMKEMMERDWNHPCIIAYSLGNEFQAQTPEGQAWVRDMGAFVKTIDTTRLLTFASYTVFRDYVQKPEDEASQYVDFISANVYGNHLKLLQKIHGIYPNKPIYISEFGMRFNAANKEEPRVAHFRKAMEAFRQCDYLVGASVWTLNDYLSRFPGTDEDGYRAWGLVTPDRVVRDSYVYLQEEFAPAVLEVVKREAGKLTIAVAARTGFPSYTLRNYQLQYGDETIKLKTLKPGERQEVTIPVTTDGVKVSLLKPGGFTAVSKTFK